MFSIGIPGMFSNGNNGSTKSNNQRTSTNQPTPRSCSRPSNRFPCSSNTLFNDKEPPESLDSILPSFSIDVIDDLKQRKVLNIGNTLTDRPNTMGTGIIGVDKIVQVNENRSPQEVNPICQNIRSSNHINASACPTEIQYRTNGRSNDPLRTNYGAARMGNHNQSTRLQDDVTGISTTENFVSTSPNTCKNTSEGRMAPQFGSDGPISHALTGPIAKPQPRRRGRNAERPAGSRGV